MTKSKTSLKMTKSKKTPLLWKGVGVRLLPFIIPSKEGNQSLSNYINWIPTYVGIKKDLYPKAVASFKLAIVADFSTSLKMTKSKTSLKMTKSKKTPLLWKGVGVSRANSYFKNTHPIC